MKRIVWTVSCPCGAWFQRTAEPGRTPPAVAAFQADHADHCRCTRSRPHPPHTDRHVTVRGAA